jgi:iron transport multicopper oxidase
VLVAAGPAFASQETEGSSLTNSGSNLRTGWYPNAAITPESVGSGTFGQLWSAQVEGQVYAQPLLDDGTLLVATEDNKVYGLNPETGAMLWPKPLYLGEPWNPADLDCADLAPWVGVTSTPVIDPAKGIAYMTHKTYASGTGSGPARWYMDAINVKTGDEEHGFPVLLAGTAQNAPGQTFEATDELQRPGLLLMEGVVYAAFGSDCDMSPWQGWVFGVSTKGEVKARWVADETGVGAGIWQSGSGLASDGEHSILLSTGNGEAPTTPAPSDEPPADLGESIVGLTVQPSGSLVATDFFAPFDAKLLSEYDADFASGGVTILPNEYFGTPTIPRLAVAVGKQGYVYLLNSEELGGFAQGAGGSDAVVDRVGPYGGVWSRPGVWPGEGGWVYIPTAAASGQVGGAGNLTVYKYGLSGTGEPTLSLQGTSAEAFGYSSGAPIITSNGTEAGSALVWTEWTPNGTGEGAQLRAYEPVPVDGAPRLVWSDPIGTSSKFAIPGVANGHLYVGTRDGHVLAFGSPVTPLLAGAASVFPTTTVGQSTEHTLTLTAGQSLTLSSLTSSSSEFTVGTPSRALPATLSAGQQIEVPITFTPTASGQVGATLTARASSGKTDAFSLSGVGQRAQAKLEATPPVVSFGGTTPGGELSAGATFRNVGGEALTINEVTLPKQPFGASGVPRTGAEIAPGGSLTITVTFDPSAEGAYTGEINLNTTGGDVGVGLSGTAATPGELALSTELAEYGKVAVGTTATRSFRLNNSGGSAVEITKSKPPISDGFAATTALDEGTVLQAAETTEQTVRFAPQSPGPAHASWAINGEDAGGPHEVQFSGIGTAPPTVVTAAASDVGETSATLNAEVNPNSEAVTSCRFEYAPATNPVVSSVPCTSDPGSGDNVVAAIAPVFGLTPDTSYDARVVATNALGTERGEIAMFTTLPALLQPGPLSLESVGRSAGPSAVVVVAKPEVKLTRRRLRVKSSGVITSSVGCPVDVTSCAGTITVRTLTPKVVALRRHGKGKAQLVMLATGSFDVLGGHRQIVKLRLSARGHALLRRHRVRKAAVIISAYTPAGAVYRSRTVATIRGANTLRHRRRRRARELRRLPGT